MEKHGYKTQYELNQKSQNSPLRAKPWPITINIGRNGELIFNNTAHNRLAISKLLSFDKIPVLVVVRHSEWESIRGEIRQADDPDGLSSKATKFLDHPDIQSCIPDEW